MRRRVAALSRDVDAARMEGDEMTSHLYSHHPELTLARGAIPIPDLFKCFSILAGARSSGNTRFSTRPR